MKHFTTPKRFIVLAILSLNCYFLNAQKHVGDWFIGTNITQINTWNINPELQKNNIPKLRTVQFGAALGLNAYFKKFILTGTFGIGYTQNDQRHSLIELDLKRTLWNAHGIAFSAGLSFQYRYNEVDIVISEQPLDLGTDPFAGQGNISMSIKQNAIGPSIRVNFFQDKDFDPQFICSYTIGVGNSPWMSNGKNVLNSPTERQNCFNFKLLLPFIYR